MGFHYNDDLKKYGSLPLGLDVEDFVYDGAYANTSRDTRFRAGVSGKPQGRPPGSKNKPKFLENSRLVDMLHEGYSREVDDTEDVGGEKISSIKSIIRQRVAAARDGDAKAQLWVIDMAREVEADQAKKQEEEFVYAEKYKAKCAKVNFGGLTGDETRICPIPNPTNIILNYRDRTVHHKGPRDVEEHWSFLSNLETRIEESVNVSDESAPVKDENTPVNAASEVSSESAEVNADSAPVNAETGLSGDNAKASEGEL